MAEIIVNQDYLDALNTHKRSNCPNLSGLNKRQLGQLARKLGLEVVATGVKERADGTGAGTRHNYPNRGKTTWRGTAKERDDRRNRDLNRKFGKMNMDKQRALGQDVLDGVRDRVKKAERERRNEERDKKLEEIQEQQKPKPKKKKKLKLVELKLTEEVEEDMIDRYTGEYARNTKKIEEAVKKVLGFNLILKTPKAEKRAVKSIIEKIGLREAMQVLEGLEKQMERSKEDMGRFRG